MSTKLPWCVVGQGALGSLMAVRLAQHQQKVTLKLRQSGTTSIAFAGQAWSFDAHATLTEPCRIFAAVKAYQVAPLLNELRQYPSFAQSTLILSYNGMLTDESTLLRPQDWHWVTTHGAYRQAGKVIHGGHGQSWLGSMTGELAQPDFFADLEQALPPLHWQTDIRQRRWQKLAINCLINPYTVIHQCRNGALAERVSRNEWRVLAGEIVRLAAHHGVTLTLENLVQQAQQVVQQTAQNRSSMLQDFLHERPLEIAYLNGFVAAASTAAGWSAPANQELFERVQSLSSIKSTTSKPKPDSAE